MYKTHDWHVDEASLAAPHHSRVSPLPPPPTPASSVVIRGATHHHLLFHREASAVAAGDP